MTCWGGRHSSPITSSSPFFRPHLLRRPGKLLPDRALHRNRPQHPDASRATGRLDARATPAHGHRREPQHRTSHLRHHRHRVECVSGNERGDPHAELRLSRAGDTSLVARPTAGNGADAGRPGVCVGVADDRARRTCPRRTAGRRAPRERPVRLELAHRPLAAGVHAGSRGVGVCLHRRSRCVSAVAVPDTWLMFRDRRLDLAPRSACAGKSNPSPRINRRTERLAQPSSSCCGSTSPASRCS